MSKYSDDPTFRLNRYIESNLRSESVIPPVGEYVTDTDTQSGWNIRFMIPGSQQPENMSQYENSSKSFKNLPFCVYTMKDNESDLWERSGLVTYTFYADSVDKLTEIKNCVIDLVNREDWSAADINYFHRNDPNYAFDFKTVSLQLSAGPQPPGDQDGRSSYLCSVYWCATYEGTGRNGNYEIHQNLGRI